MKKCVPPDDLSGRYNACTKFPSLTRAKILRTRLHNVLYRIHTHAPIPGATYILYSVLWILLFCCFHCTRSIYIGIVIAIMIMSATRRFRLYTLVLSTFKYPGLNYPTLRGIYILQNKNNIPITRLRARRIESP